MSADGLRPAQDVVAEGLAAAGGRACLVLVEDVHEVEVRFAENTTTTNGARRDRRVTVVAFHEAAGGTAVGTASRGGEVDVAALVAAASADAASAAPAEDAAPLLGPADQPDPTVRARFEDGPATTDLSVLRGVLDDLGGAFARAEAAGRVLAGFAEHRAATTYLGSSTGLRAAHAQSDGALHLVGRSVDGTASAWAGAGTTGFADCSLDGLEETVVGRLGWASRRVDLPAGRYEAVLPGEAVADLMIALAGELGGRDAEDGRTVYSRAGGGTRVGDRLAALDLDLWSDPADAELACPPFVATSSSSADTSVFDNGLPVGRTEWLRSGRLERLRYHRAGAARSGVGATPWVGNLVLEAPGATASLDELVAATGRGLLLTCLWYIREVDPATLLLTGLTRDGVYLVEDGRVVGAVNNFRFNESPVDLLGRITEVGASHRALGREFGEWMGRTRMPAVRVPDFNMSSVSQAT